MSEPLKCPKCYTEVKPKTEEFKFGRVRVIIPAEGEKVHELRQKVREMFDIEIGVE